MHHRVVLSALDKYLQSHADIATSIIELPVGGQLAAIEQDLIDVGFVLREERNCESETLAAAVILHHCMVVALPASSPFARKQTIAPDDLRQICTIEVFTKSIVDRNDRPSGLYTAAVAGIAETPRKEGLEALMSVEAGLGAAILPEEVMQVHHEGVVFRPIRPIIRHGTSIVWRRNETQHAVTDFVNCVRSAVTNGSARSEHMRKRGRIMPVARDRTEG